MSTGHNSRLTASSLARIIQVAILYGYLYDQDHTNINTGVYVRKDTWTFLRDFLTEFFLISTMYGSKLLINTPMLI